MITNLVVCICIVQLAFWHNSTNQGYRQKEWECFKEILEKYMVNLSINVFFKSFKSKDVLLLFILFVGGT